MRLQWPIRVFSDGTIKIEAKASRAVDFDTTEPFYVKALATDSPKDFDMNFQQVKPLVVTCSFGWVSGATEFAIGCWRQRKCRHRYYSVGSTVGT